MTKIHLLYCLCAVFCFFSGQAFGQSESKISVETQLKKADDILHETLKWFSKQKDIELNNEDIGLFISMAKVLECYYIQKDLESSNKDIFNNRAKVLEWFSKQKYLQSYNEKKFTATPRESYNESTYITTPNESYNENSSTITPKDISQLPKDCTEIKENGINKSGVYEVKPIGRDADPVYFKVYCDMKTDGGGWTVFQRRGDFGHPEDYFFRNWYNYSVGFGNLDEDFWLGNDKIHSLTIQGAYTLRIDMKDKEGNSRYAQYQGFSIGSEKQQYQLRILKSTYSGNAGDSLTLHHNHRMFTTFDRDNDLSKEKNCASAYKGAWWYSACYGSSLNGLYLNGKYESYGDGVVWFRWKGIHYSIPDVEMKMRRN